MSIRQSQVVTFSFGTFSPSANVNASVGPVGTLFQNSVATTVGVLIDNVGPGLYTATFILPAMSLGDTMELQIAATVAGVAQTDYLWRQTYDVPLADIQEIAQTAADAALADCVVDVSGDSAGMPRTLTKWLSGSGQTVQIGPSQSLYQTSGSPVTSDTEIAGSQIAVRSPCAAAPANRRYVFEGGNDSADGLTPQTAWGSVARIITAINNNEIPASGTAANIGWANELGQTADATTLVTPDDHIAWDDAYLAGKRVNTAGVFILNGTLQQTAQINLGGRCLTSYGPTPALLKINLTLTDTYTQPNAGSHPLVWQTTGTYPKAVLRENDAQLQPLGLDSGAGFANIAAAISHITAGVCYTDPTTNVLYFAPIAGGNPNSDGIVRTYSPSLLGGVDGQLLDITGGVIYNVNSDGGLIATYYDGTQGGIAYPLAQENFAITDLSVISVVHGCTASRFGGKHAFAAVAANAGGHLLWVDCVATLGPGGTNSGGWTAFVDFSSSAAPSSMISTYLRCSTINGQSNVGTTGGNDQDLTGNGGYSALISHGVSQPGVFALRRLIDCNWGGFVSLGDITTTAATADNCQFSQSLGTVGCAAIIRRCNIAYRFPDLNENAPTDQPILFQECTFNPAGSGYNGNCKLEGPVTLLNCVLNQNTSSGNTSSWGRTGPYNVKIIGGSVNAPNETLALIAVYDIGDVISFGPGVQITATGAGPIISIYEGGSEKTWSDAISMGWVVAGVGNQFNGTLV